MIGKAGDAKLFTKAEEGWPSAAATDVPKTGYNSQALVITFIGSAAACAVLAAVLKKKERFSEK